MLAVLYTSSSTAYASGFLSHSATPSKWRSATHPGASANGLRAGQHLIVMDSEAGVTTVFDDLSEGQIFGPTKPAHAWPKPWTNLESQENVQTVKAKSGQLMEPLKTDMGDDEIFVSGDSIHILKHHGSYMQQDRSLKGVGKKQSYQFMLRLKVPVGEVSQHRSPG